MLDRANTRVQVLQTAQSSRTFEARVANLVASLNDNATPVRFAALGNLSRELARCHEEAPAMIQARQEQAPPCRCAAQGSLHMPRVNPETTTFLGSGRLTPPRP
jgi:hypothetical protein